MPFYKSMVRNKGFSGVCITIWRINYIYCRSWKKKRDQCMPIDFTYQMFLSYFGKQDFFITTVENFSSLFFFFVFLYLDLFGLDCQKFLVTILFLFLFVCFFFFLFFFLLFFYLARDSCKKWQEKYKQAGSDIAE